MSASISGPYLLAAAVAPAAFETAAKALPPPSPLALVEVTDIDSLSVSPNGGALVFRTVRADLARDSYTLEWYSVDPGSGLVRDLGSGGEPVYADPGLIQAEAPAWIDDHSFAVRNRIDDALGLWRFDLETGASTPLVVPDADVDDYSLGDGGGALLYKIGPTREEIRRAERQEYDKGILVDSSVDLAQNLYRGGSINGRMSSQRLVGYWYVRGGLLGRVPRQEHRLDLHTGIDSLVGAPAAPPAFDPHKALPATESLNPAGDIARASWNGTSGEVTVTDRNGSVQRCTDPLCRTGHVAALLWRPGSDEVLLTFMDKERRQSLALWDVKSQLLRKLVSSEGLLSGGRRHMMPCAISHAAAFCVAASPASAPSVARIDLDDGAMKTLFDPNEDFRLSYSPTVEYLRVNTGDGHEASALIMRDRGLKGPSPLYVNYYSCEGFLRGGEGDEWPIPSLIAAGFTVACINAVSSSGPQDAIEDYWIGLGAVRAVIDRLAAAGAVDPHKVAMGGLSFGSEVAMWTAMNSRLLAALSISSVQVEPADYWLSSMPGSDQPGTVRKVWGLGRPEETPARWRLVSPALNVNRISAPILFQLPEQEARRIPELYSRLRQSGVPAELYAFPDEDHIKLQPRHRLSIYERNLDWFRYWLQDYRDPDPSKVEQYERWDRLRKQQGSDRPNWQSLGGRAQAQRAR